MIESTGAEIVIKLLEIHGITTVAGIPGASVLPLYNELHKSSINHVLVRQEQAAGFLAEGIARSTEKPAVCFATSGPGVMNLLTALADAKADSIPLIAITGQVASQFVGTDAFQEADTFGLSLPITKHSILVKSPRELLDVIPKAFAVASSGRPGTVLIDIPVDIQKQKVAFEKWPVPISMEHRYSRFRTIGKELAENLQIFYKTLISAKNPVLFVGGGCNSEKTSRALEEFLSLMPISVVSSLMGLGAVPSSYKNFFGMTGIYGHECANQCVKNADVILALGVRFDERSFGFGESLNPNIKILHVDIDAAEINKLQNSFCGIVADTESVFRDGLGFSR
jgi:acetolactate synthase-1/2/3 large subunit